MVYIKANLDKLKKKTEFLIRFLQKSDQKQLRKLHKISGGLLKHLYPKEILFIFLF